MSTLFFSYSHVDEKLRDQLAKHLTGLEHQGVLSSWHDRRIPAGSEFAAVIDEFLNAADIILLLISPDFIASKYCYDIEMKRALERHEAGDAIVIPVILRPCDWQDLPFGKLNAAPKNGKAVIDWANRDKAFLDVVLKIKQTLQTRNPTQTKQNSPSAEGRVPPFFAVPFERNTLILGRDPTIEGIRMVLEQQGRQAIVGPAGIGKTQVAVEYAYRYRESYQYVFWAAAGSSEALLSSWRGLAQHLNIPVEADQQAVRHRLEILPASCLIVLDGAEQPATLLPFLPASGRSHLLITSIDAGLDKLRIYEPVILGELNSEQAEKFLLRRTGRTTLSDPVEIESVRKLAGPYLGGFPLALEQAGAYITSMHCSFADYRRGYEAQHLGLLNKGDPNFYNRTLSSAVSETLGKLEPASCEIAQAIAFSDEETVPREFLMAAASHPEAALDLQRKREDVLALDEAVAPLFSYSIVRRDHHSGHYSMHGLVRLAIRELTDAVLHPKLERIVIHACNACIHLDLFSAAAESPFGIRAVSLLLPTPSVASEDGGQLLGKVGWLLLSSHKAEPAKYLFERSLQIISGASRPAKAQAGFARVGLAKLAETFESNPTAAMKLYGDFLEATPEDSQPELRVLAQNNLGDLYRVRGQFAEAEKLLTASLASREAMFGKNHPAIATARNNLGNVFGARGLAMASRGDSTGSTRSFTKALAYYRESYGIRQRLLTAPHPYLANSLNNLGWIYTMLGWYNAAEEPLLKALGMWKEVYGADHPEVAKTCGNLINLYKATGSRKKLREIEASCKAAEA